MMNHKRFVLQAIDPTTDCVALEVVFEVADVNELRAQLRLDPEDFDPRAEYELDRSDVDRIKSRFEVEFQPGDLRVSIRPWCPVDALPYKVHTRRELAMMLAGTKPLAVFIGCYPSNPEYEEIPERLFEPHVKSGRFVKREHICSESRGQGRKSRKVLYAPPDEQWRIDAYLLLHGTAERSGWNEGFERMEGSLLGYEDWQNDAYIEMIYRIGRSSSESSSVASC